MVVEIATINVKDGMSEAFEEGVAKARPVILRAEGCHGVSLHKSVEFPLRYRLMVQWESVENHTVTFRASEGFTQWRAAVGHCFAETPSVEHVVEVSLPQ
jgi:quinol monooxygenase YgiN